MVTNKGKAATAAVEKFLAKQQKKYGSAVKMASAIDVPEVLPLNLPDVDLASGVGGLCRGRVYEIFGAESSGKTTACFHVIKQIQRLGENALYIDIENTFDPIWAARNGVDTARLGYVRALSGEQALQIAREALEEAVFSLIIVDSVAMMLTDEEAGKDLEKVTVATQARLMSKSTRILNNLIAKTNAIVLWVNQLRNKAGVVYGSPETTTGGMALKHAASGRIRLFKRPVEGKSYSMVEWRFVKNKVGSAAIGKGFAKFDPTHGFVESYGVGRAAVGLGIVKKLNKQSYSYNGKAWKGIEALEADVEKNPALCEELKQAIYNTIQEHRLRVDDIVPVQDISDDETGPEVFVTGQEPDADVSAKKIESKESTDSTEEPSDDEE